MSRDEFPSGASEQELEALLRASDPDAPAPGAFRDELRWGFVTGALVGAEPNAETSQSSTELRTPDGVPYDLESSMAQMPIAPPARDSFRAGLRSRFVAASMAEEGFSEPSRPGQAGGAGAGLPDREAAPARGRLQRLLVPVAAAAAIVAVYLLAPTPPHWEVRFEPRGTVQVAGVELEASDAGRIGAELARGGVLRTGANTVELRLADELVLEVQPSTELRLQPLNKDAGLAMKLRSGEVFVETLSGYDGRPLGVDTAEASVVVTGTVFGVLVDGDGTCVCVARGGVRVRPAGSEDAASAVVEAGYSLRLPPQSSGAAAMEKTFEEHRPHSDPLVRFDAEH